MYCRNCGKELPAGANNCIQCGTPVGLGDKYCLGCGWPTDPSSAACPRCGADTRAAQRQPGWDGGFGAPPSADPVYSGDVRQPKSKLVAGLLGILLGSLGIHHFYLGFTQRGTIQLVVTLVGGVVSCGIASAAMGIWGLVEGIQILTGTINRDAAGVPLKE